MIAGYILYGIFFLDVILMIYISIMRKKFKETIAQDKKRASRTMYFLYLGLGMVGTILGLAFSGVKSELVTLGGLFAAVTVTAIYSAVRVTIQSRG